jgi:hypothetical protein
LSRDAELRGVALVDRAAALDGLGDARDEGAASAIGGRAGGDAAGLAVVRRAVAAGAVAADAVDAEARGALGGVGAALA